MLTIREKEARGGKLAGLAVHYLLETVRHCPEILASGSKRKEGLVGIAS